MERMTKKAFMDLHKNKKLWLITSGFNKPKEECFNLLLKYNGELIYKETSSINVNSQKDYCHIDIFSVRPLSGTYAGKTIIIIEETIDNSKNANCSWNDIQKDCIFYMVK